MEGLADEVRRMSYRAVFFDAGETLLSAHPSFAELVATVLVEQGCRVDAGDVEGAFESVAKMFLEFGEKIGSDTWSTSPEVSRRFWGMIYAAELDFLGIPDPEGRLADLLYERFTRHESYRMFPDALPALESIRGAGLWVGLISNFEEWLEAMLGEWEVTHLFDALVISGKEGIEKPNPEIFRRALERARVEPQDAVYVGDHPSIDIAAAEAVGMTGVLIDRRGRHPSFEGEKITNLRELPPLLGINS